VILAKPQIKTMAAFSTSTGCSGSGFIQILGHAILESSTAGLAAAMDASFGQPMSDRKTYRVTGAQPRLQPAQDRPVGGCAPPAASSLVFTQ